MPFDDLLAGRQADAGAGVLGSRVQPFEDDEQLVGILGIDADTIVADRECPSAVVPFGTDVNFRRTIAPELYGVAE
jgi:hypothetical protein